MRASFPFRRGTSPPVGNLRYKALLILFICLQGVFISRVAEDGPSGKAGLQVGDKLLSVNDHNLVGAEHHEAVAVLKEAGNAIVMEVAREVLRGPPVSFRKKPL